MNHNERRRQDRLARAGLPLGPRIWHIALCGYLNNKAAGNKRRAELWRLATFPLSNWT